MGQGGIFINSIVILIKEESNTMRYMEDNRGQGFDTFKLLIAAVVAMVILGIVTNVFQKIYNMIIGLNCVSNPISELTGKISQAQGGMITVTGDLCLSKGEEIDASNLYNAISSVESVTFNCKSNAPVCASGNPPALTVSSDKVFANRDTNFKARVTCTSSGGYAGGFQCEIEIINRK